MAYTVTITGTGSTSDCYVAIGATIYTKASTVTVEAGTNIFCYADTSSYGNPKIIFNGTTVATGGGSYTFTIINDAQIALSASSFGDNTVTITMSKPVDPLEPKDGHNTLIGGTACQIESGTVLIGGVEYEIEKGEVLIGGTAYEIPVAGGTCTVTIRGSGGGNCYIGIDGKRYNDSATVEVTKGTVISCTVTYVYGRNGYIYLNGTTVKTATQSATPANYQYTVKNNVSISLDSGGRNSATVKIVDT